MKLASLRIMAAALTTFLLPGVAMPVLAQNTSPPPTDSSIAGNRLDLDNPEDALQVFRKLLCSVEDGKTVYFTWQGEVYSRQPGVPDRHVFNVQGMSARACNSLTSA